MKEEKKETTLEKKEETETAQAGARPSPCPPIGDVDGDGFVTASDALLALRIAVGQSGFTPTQIKNANVTLDNQVTASDALTILNYAVGNINTFPACNPPSTELRMISVGDPRDGAANTRLASTFINASDADFVCWLGDYTGGDSKGTVVQAMKMCTKKAYYVEGNHDIGSFTGWFGVPPAQYYADVKGFQIAMPAFNWTNYNWSQVNATKPLLIFNHCPIPPLDCDPHICASKDSSGKGLLDRLKMFNTKGYYASHTHGMSHDVQITNSGGKAFCVTEPAITIVRCGATPKLVGYTLFKSDGSVWYKQLDVSKPWAPVVFSPGDRVV